MRNVSRLFYTTAICLVLLVSCLPGLADDERDASKAGRTIGWRVLEPGPEPTPEEYEQAGLDLADLNPEQLALVQGLRYLIRPAEHAKIFPHQPVDTALLAWESEPHWAMTQEELVRLWALLSVRYPKPSLLKRDLARLLERPVDAFGSNLSWYGMQALVIRAALIHEDLADIARLKDRLKEIAKATDAVPTGALSRVGMGIHGVFWRVVVRRISYEFNKLPESKPTDDTVVALSKVSLSEMKAAEPHSGVFILHGGQKNDYAMLALFGHAAMSLVASAPAGCFNKAATNAATGSVRRTKQGVVPAASDAFTSRACSVLLLAGLDRSIVPAKLQRSGAWEKHLIDNLKISIGDDGANCEEAGFGVSSGLLGQYNEWPVQRNPSVTRAQSRAVETACMIVALSSGFMPPAPGPKIEAWKLPWTEEQVTKLMRAATARAAVDYNRATRELQVQIDEAIRRGCESLIAAQNKDGSFPHLTFYGGPVWDVATGNAYTALSAMTLLHGGWERDSAPVKKALENLEKKVKTKDTGTYAGGIVLLFMHRYYQDEMVEAGVFNATTPEEYERARAVVWAKLPRKHRSMVQEVADTVASHHNGPGLGWDYGIMRMRPAGDNSNSQYGMLGIRAASQLGARIDTRLYVTEMQRLVDQFWVDESLPRVAPQAPTREIESNPERRTAARHPRPDRPTGAGHPAVGVPVGGWDYICAKAIGARPAMTATGIANLVMCMDELKLHGIEEPKLIEAARERVIGGLAYLAEAFPDRHMVTYVPSTSPGGGRGLFYDLYAIERACLMADARVLHGNTDWYRGGAQLLMILQHEEGGWRYVEKEKSQLDLLSTCWAVLFLKLASVPVVTNPVRHGQPAPEPKPKGPVTGGPKD